MLGILFYDIKFFIWNNLRNVGHTFYDIKFLLWNNLRNVGHTFRTHTQLNTTTSSSFGPPSHHSRRHAWHSPPSRIFRRPAAILKDTQVHPCLLFIHKVLGVRALVLPVPTLLAQSHNSTFGWAQKIDMYRLRRLEHLQTTSNVADTIVVTGDWTFDTKLCHASSQSMPTFESKRLPPLVFAFSIMYAFNLWLTLLHLNVSERSPPFFQRLEASILLWNVIKSLFHFCEAFGYLERSSIANCVPFKLIKTWKLSRRQLRLFLSLRYRINWQI